MNAKLPAYRIAMTLWFATGGVECLQKNWLKVLADR